jgi:NTE family protein
MERAANNAVVLRADLQFRIKGNHYALWKMNIGKVFDAFNQFTEPSTTIFGTGVTYGYSSPVGPVEVTLMTASGTWKPILFINLGYWIH